jgi:hypothetical protein
VKSWIVIIQIVVFQARMDVAFFLTSPSQIQRLKCTRVLSSSPWSSY